MAVKFLGYIDSIEEELEDKRRCLFGCETTDLSDLPTTAGFTLPSGGVTSAPAAWSIALVGGGGVKYFNGTSWGDL